MKKLSIFCGIVLVLTLISGFANAQSIWFDIDQDGIADDPCELEIMKSETVQVDLYLNWDYPWNIKSIGYRFNWGTGMSVVSYSVPYKPGGPWDAAGTNPDTNYYVCSLFEQGSGIPAPDPAVPLHSFVMRYDNPTATIISVTDIIVLDIDTEEYYSGDVFCTINQLPATTTTITPPRSTTTTTSSVITSSSTIFSTTTTVKLTPDTTTTTTEKCLSKKIYGEDSEEAELLRYFRDNVLNKTPEGQEIISTYYLWSPAIVCAMEKDEEFKEDVKKLIDVILVLIRTAAE